MNPLLNCSLGQLRQRRGVKWQAYGPDVLPLWVAEMDVQLAEPVRKVLQDAVASGETGYAWAGELPAAYADFAQARFGWRPDPAAMDLIPDVMQGITEVLATLTAPGDGVVVTTPVYPPFFAFVEALGRRIVTAPLGPDLRLDLAALERAFSTAGTRVLLLCNPHNPTGTVASRAELLAVAELAHRYGIRVLVDEIHSPLVYPGLDHTPFQALDVPAARQSFAFVSASKAWNLPGLKAALLIAGPEALADRDRLPATTQFGVGSLGVLAGVAALRDGGPWLADLLAGLAENRRLLGDLLAAELPEVGYRPPRRHLPGLAGLPGARPR